MDTIYFTENVLETTENFTDKRGEAPRPPGPTLNPPMGTKALNMNFNAPNIFVFYTWKKVS